ncbi:MAG: hypothetical protein CW338_00600 [Clostridiales bacterium]|nr:hypothetical protein [Clostridiales bacterium]
MSSKKNTKNVKNKNVKKAAETAPVKDMTDAGEQITGYPLVIWWMAVTGILCTLILGIVQCPDIAPTGWYVLLLSLSYAAVFCAFLFFREGKRLPAILCALVPVLYEVVNEVVFASVFSPVSAVIYIGMPLMLVVFILFWHEGNKDTIPLIGVLWAMFLLFIEVTNYLNLVMAVFGGGTPLYLLFVVSRLCYMLMFLYGLWKAGNVKFLRTRSY